MKTSRGSISTGLFVMLGLMLVIASAVLFRDGLFFRNNVRFIAYFDGSHRGLGLGAPVLLRGVVIGRVSDIRVEFDATNPELIRIPVVMDLNPQSLIAVSNQPKDTDDVVALLIERGLRAQLILQSFVINQLVVSLDFHPNTTPRFVQVGDSDLRELPTIASPLDAIARTFDNFSLDEALEDVRATLKGVRQIAESPQLLAILADAQGVVAETRRAVPAVSEQLQTVLRETTLTLTTTRAAVTQATALLPTLQTTLQRYEQLGASLQTDTRATLNALRPVLVRSQGLVTQLDRAVATAHQRLQQLDGVLNDGQRLLQRSQQLFASDGSLGYSLPRALRDLSAMATSLKNLADLLEQQPAVLLRGRGGGS